MELSGLKGLDLRNCYSLVVIPRYVVSRLSQLEYLSMKGSSYIKWELEGFNIGERNTVCLSELKRLSCLKALEVEVSNPSLLPEDDVIFDSLSLTRYSIAIGDMVGHPISIGMPVDEHKASRRLLLKRVKSLQILKCFSKLLKRSQVVHLKSLKDTKDVVY